MARIKSRRIFDEILAKGIRAGQIPARSREAREWFRNVAKKVSISPNVLMKEEQDRLKKRPNIGRMYAYFYDPKHKKTLPYYDKFPLIFMVGPANKGFYGINLHYLPPVMRAKLMNTLYDIVNNEKYDETTKLKISYDVLKSTGANKWFRPCFKHYLWKHVRSQFMLVESVEWDIAMMLPLARFEKASRAQVYKDSREKVNS